MGALSTSRYFSAITGPNFSTRSYPLLANSKNVGATAAVIIKMICFLLLEEEFNNSLAHNLSKQNRVDPIGNDFSF